jgi:single-stranded DNA-binding protein
MDEGSVSVAAPVLRPGARVSVNGRLAAFLYARRNGAVIRYEGERQSRVVSVHKLEPMHTLQGR